MTESLTFAVQHNPVSRVSNKSKHRLRKHTTTTTTTTTTAKSIFSSNSSHTKDTSTTSSSNKTRRSNSKLQVQKQKEKALIQAGPVREISFPIPLDVQIQIEKIARQLQRQQLLMLKHQQKPMSVKAEETKVPSDANKSLETKKYAFLSFPRKSLTGEKWNPVEVEKASTVNDEITKEIDNLQKLIKSNQTKKSIEPKKSHDSERLNGSVPVSQQTLPARKLTALERQLKLAILTEKIRRLKENTNLLDANKTTNNTKTTSTKVTNITSRNVKVRNTNVFNAEEKYPFPKTDTLVEVKEAEKRQLSPNRKNGVVFNSKVHRDSDILILNRVSSLYVPSGKYADRLDMNKLISAKKQSMDKNEEKVSGASKKNQEEKETNQEKAKAFMIKIRLSKERNSSTSLSVMKDGEVLVSKTLRVDQQQQQKLPKTESKKMISILNEQLLESRDFKVQRADLVNQDKAKPIDKMSKIKPKKMKLIKSKKDVPLPKITKNVVIKDLPQRDLNGHENTGKKEDTYEKTISTDTTIYNVPIQTIHPRKVMNAAEKIIAKNANTNKSVKSNNFYELNTYIYHAQNQVYTPHIYQYYSHYSYLH